MPGRAESRVTDRLDQIEVYLLICGEGEDSVTVTPRLTRFPIARFPIARIFEAAKKVLHSAVLYCNYT